MPAGRLVYKRTRITNIYGFFVGIDEYQPNQGSSRGNVPNLRGCVRDAQGIFAGFQLQPTHGRLMINQEATRKNILRAIQGYVNNLKNRDLLIFSVSAHGTIINNDFAIVPHDIEMDNMLGTVLSTRYLLDALSTIAKNGGKVLVILDACHAGGMSFDIGKFSGILSGSGISCLNSAGPNESAYESVFDGAKSQGAFTKYLIDGLAGKADPDQLKIITLRNLYDYIYQNVSSHFPQHPVLIGTLEGDTILKTID